MRNFEVVSELVCIFICHVNPQRPIGTIGHLFGRVDIVAILPVYHEI